jgi:putative polyhydroxyalkanoate system protein
MIDIVRGHSLSKEEARRAVDMVVKQMEIRLGLLGMVAQWSGDTLKLNGVEGPAQGMTGEFAVGDDKVRVWLRLSPTLRSMRATIEANLHQFLARSFPP